MGLFYTEDESCSIRGLELPDESLWIARADLKQQAL
jgi:hypothetical protein